MSKNINKEVEPQKKRQVIIETDGNSVVITKAEVAGQLELIAIINSVLAYLTQQPKQ